MSEVANQEKKVAVKEGPASVAGTDYMNFLASGKATVKPQVQLAQVGPQQEGEGETNTVWDD